MLCNSYKTRNWQIWWYLKMAENQRLKALFAKCTAAELTGKRWAETKHFLGSFQYVTETAGQLCSRDASQGSSESWYALQAFKPTYSKKYFVWSGDFRHDIKSLSFHGVYEELFADVCNKVTAFATKDDFIRVVFQNRQLDAPSFLRRIRKDRTLFFSSLKHVQNDIFFQM